MNRDETEEAAFRRAREWMVEHDLRRKGIRDERVLQAMLRVPRHRFVSESLSELAYRDIPLSTSAGQTISQPYIVARMTEALRLRPGDRVLELGTGSGYQTAVLAELGADVWSIERSPTLHRDARDRLRNLGYDRPRLIEGDGTLGLPEEAPFDRILATGGLPRVPEALWAQLRLGALFVGPIGGRTAQRLVRVERDPAGPRTKSLLACRFVPLIGQHGWPPEDGKGERWT